MVTKISNNRSIEVAMPQLIQQKDLSLRFVIKWKNIAEKSLRMKKALLTPETELVYPLYHYQTSSVAGVWFISIDGVHVDYFYMYKSIKLAGLEEHKVFKAAEALGFLFNDQVVGVTRSVFFDHLLPSQKFVVTDSMYTPDGHRWFKAQYNLAFARKYKVYAIYLKARDAKNSIFEIDLNSFPNLQISYWGMSDEYQHYRFAIEYPD